MQIARSRTCYNAGRAQIKGNHTPNFFISQAKALALTEAPALAQTPTLALTSTSAPAPSLSGIYTDEDLQKVIKLALELFV